MERDAPAIAAEGIRVAFGATVALRGVTLTVPWGTRVALLGPNGAGKSTLLRVLATLVRPTGGTVRVAGRNLWREPPAARRLLGVVGHQTFLYDELTALENLRVFAELYDVPGASQRCVWALDAVELAGKRDARVRNLSRGQQQRLTLARALLHDPPLLLFDEPDTGLDVGAFDLLTGLVGAGRTLVMATHNLRQAARLCDRFALLVDGRLVAEGTIESAEWLDAVYRRQAGVLTAGHAA